MSSLNKIDDLILDGIDFKSTDEMAQFLAIVYKTIKHEGLLSVDKDDPGGTTKYGISQRAYPNLDIIKLSKADAVKIYYKDYWIKYKIQSLPNEIRHIIFDGVVNQGNRIIKILQQVVNIKGGNLVVDGLIGKNTIAQAKKYKPEVNRIRAYRIMHYANLVKRKPKLEKYYYGWFVRALAV